MSVMRAHDPIKSIRYSFFFFAIVFTAFVLYGMGIELLPVINGVLGLLIPVDVKTVQAVDLFKYIEGQGLNASLQLSLAKPLISLRTVIEANPVPANAFAATVLSCILGCNWLFIRRLSNRQQMIAVWLQLFVLLILFFYTFDLSIEFILDKLPFMITEGVWRTLYISAISILIATIIALIGAVAKLSSNGIIYGAASFYTSLFRGLPLLMQVYLIYQGLPQLGYVVDAVPAGILALSLCYGAYMTEIFRAGIQSIDRGQFEGAAALGLKGPHTMLFVILPQAMRVIVPPTGSQFIAMLKDSSLVSVVGVWELTYLSRTLGQKEFKHMEMLITAALIYWFLSIVLELVQARLEKHFAVSTKR